jgi:hypothetical protein
LNTRDSQRKFDKIPQNEQYPNVTKVNHCAKPVEIGNTNIKASNQVESNDQKQINQYSSTVITRVKEEINIEQKN